MSKPTPTFYLLYGDDDLSIDEAVKQFHSAMGADGDLNTSEFDGDSATVPEVLNAVSSYPFLSDKRLVIVRGWLNALNKAGLDKLAEELPSLPDYARLVMIERGAPNKSNPVLKIAQSHERGYAKDYSAPKDTTTWIIKRAKSDYDAEIEPKAAAALAQVTGTDLRRADNELVKLVSYVDGKRPITTADVALLTPYVEEANVFDMVDALATGKGDVAMKIMIRALDENTRDPGFGLFTLFANQFQRLLLAREHLSNGGSPNDLPKLLGIHPYPASKIATQSRAFSVEDLEKIYTRIQRYDFEIKTGQIDVKLALELLVTSLSR